MFKPLKSAVIFCLAMVAYGCQIPDHQADPKHERVEEIEEVVPHSGQAEMEKLMKECMELNKPGPHHQRLNNMIGEWTTVHKIWMGGPGTKPTVSTGTSTCKWILAGRYVEEILKCSLCLPDFANPGKMITMPFTGKGTTGYDNFRNMYVSTWCDSMGTQMFMTKGTWLAQENKYVYYGEMDEPALKVVGRMAKLVITIIDKDTHRFEMFDLHAGENNKIMEITYTRK